jgi:two-component system response regulator YesN
VYKVFLVEDEIVVREGIRSSIPWGKTSCSLAGEAPDGELALSMIQDIKPDILITDIRMPFMDGLALSRIVKKTMPWIKIIILSGHDEFEYAREAITLGVEEYLLKPVSAQDMLNTLNKIAGRIDEEKKKLLDIEKLKAQARSSADILRDKWFLGFMNEKIPAARAIEEGREFGIELLARSYMVLAVGIVSPAGEESQLVPVKVILRTITEKYANSVCFSESREYYVILIKDIQDTEANAGLEESAYAIAQALKYEVERNTRCKVAVGIGQEVERIGDVVKSCTEARKILDFCIARDLFEISNISLLQRGGKFFDPSGLRNIGGDMFLTKLKYASKKDIDSIINEYLGVIGGNFSENEMMAYLVLGEIILAASKLAESLGGDIRKIAPFSINREDFLHVTSSKELFFEKIKALLEALLEYRDAHTEGRYQSVIVKAREYIDQHFASEDISLYSTASHVGISPNHLSTVFAQETGENFIEYLTRVRIEKAKQLLKGTAMKNADIASETGFSDPHYFSYIFKKNTGLSPREFRQACRR